MPLLPARSLSQRRPSCSSTNPPHPPLSSYSTEPLYLEDFHEHCLSCLCILSEFSSSSPTAKLLPGVRFPSPHTTMQTTEAPTALDFAGAYSVHCSEEPANHAPPSSVGDTPTPERQTQSGPDRVTNNITMPYRGQSHSVDVHVSDRYSAEALRTNKGGTEEGDSQSLRPPLCIKALRKE